MPSASDAIVRILTEADAARNGVGVNWQAVFEAVGKIATSITTIDDTLQLRTGDEAKDERSEGDG